MSKHLYLSLLATTAAFTLAATLQAAPTVSGETKQWHKVTLTFDGPESSESATPNPFTDYRLDVAFSCEGESIVVPGYFAADGDAANTSADAGNKWRVHFSPNVRGKWKWQASFKKGTDVAMADDSSGTESGGYFDGETGSFTITASDKQAPRYASARHTQTNQFALSCDHRQWSGVSKGGGRCTGEFPGLR